MAPRRANTESNGDSRRQGGKVGLAVSSRHRPLAFSRKGLPLGLCLLCKLISLSQRLQAFQCVDIVRAEGQNFTIFPLRLRDLSQLRVSLAESQSPIVSSPSHAQSFAVGFGGFIPHFELGVDRSQFCEDGRGILPLGFRLLQQFFVLLRVSLGRE